MRPPTRSSCDLCTCSDFVVWKLPTFGDSEPLRPSLRAEQKEGLGKSLLILGSQAAVPLRARTRSELWDAAQDGQSARRTLNSSEPFGHGSAPVGRLLRADTVRQNRNAVPRVSTRCLDQFSRGVKGYLIIHRSGLSGHQGVVVLERTAGKYEAGVRWDGPFETLAWKKKKIGL